MQKIDPERLHNLRQKKGLSRPQLSKKAGIAEKTIQRIEKEPQPSQQKTLNRLAKALGVEPGVLTGELPLPESDKASTPDPERVQIGAQVAPKVKLSYDLIKRRYGVSATEIINMAPLFFALLAEGCLAWRREKLKELKEGIDRLDQIDGFWHGQGLPFAVTPVPEAIEAEEDSIAKADLFGEYLLDRMTYDLDPSTDNPFASYLRRLKAELDIPSVVDVDSGDLMFGSPLKFPNYDICRDELDDIANGSEYAKKALETGQVRLSEIPKYLMAEDAGGTRAGWLEVRELEVEVADRLAKGLKDLEGTSEKHIEMLEKMLGPEVMYIVRSDISDPDSALRKRIEEYGITMDEELVRLLAGEPIEVTESQETNPVIEKGGDDQ